MSMKAHSSHYSLHFHYGTSPKMAFAFKFVHSISLSDQIPTLDGHLVQISMGFHLLEKLVHMCRSKYFQGPLHFPNIMFVYV